ncbi:MAG TPA: tyrosine-type recombinase/integrase [Solirubrobacterales bacterium]|nr:tyrosine-type recombinase/integrase [Solirubrobacterales bacterium]
MPPAVEVLLQRYEDHLRGDCGLAPSTIGYRLRYARDLLQQLKVHRASQLKAWVPTKIAEHVAAAGRRRKPSSGQVLASSIRAFLRFLLLQGLLPQDLAAAVPSFANWRLSALPAVVERSDLEKLLAAIDSSSPVGMRDQGVVLCITDLGLRAADVAAITTDAVDPIAGVLRIKHPKERRVAELPMTNRLATALSRYLRRGRPPCAARALFVIHRAPVGKALKPIGIRGIVTRSAARAGLGKLIRGTHVIRHSVASSLINAGASIKEIADLLGHRSIDTTAIYAKVDLRSLAGVALPWPGSREVFQ